MIWWAITAGAWAADPSGLEAEDPTCPADGGWLDGHQHLRALSLDLRGYLPSEQDEARLVGGEVPEALVDEWLDSPEFADRVVRHHRALLWNNVSNVTLLTNNAYLGSLDGIYYRRNLTDEYRGKLEQHCGNFPATLDAQGRPVPTVLPDGTLQEGWVEVAPYWNPAAPIKVCAFDAQPGDYSPSGTDCSTLQAQSDPDCGCGEDLRFCAISTYHQPVNQAIGADVDHRITAMIEQDRPYTDLFLGTTGFVNGPLVYFYKYQSDLPGGARFVELPVDPELLPDLAFTDDDTWVEIDLGPQHAGVLSSPAWLVRFQTNRARANRYYNSFLCQPFQPPEGGIPEAADGSLTLDLTVREGCKYCHALLEPTAAYWGRWTPSGGGWLDPVNFPAFDPECEACANGLKTCTDTCSKFYVTRVMSTEEEPYAGWLASYEFLEERHQPHVDQGPELLVEQTMADGRLPTCVADTTASWLLGRPVDADDAAWTSDLAQGFVGSGWDYKELVKSVVMSDAYRRVRP